MTDTPFLPVPRPLTERYDTHVVNPWVRENRFVSMQLVGVSKSYLSRIFKMETGIPLWDYLNRFRIQKAKELLLLTDDTITEIAAAVGYEDVGYFGRIFHEAVNCSPGPTASSPAPPSPADIAAAYPRLGRVISHTTTPAPSSRTTRGATGTRLARRRRRHQRPLGLDPRVRFRQLQPQAPLVPGHRPALVGAEGRLHDKRILDHCQRNWAARLAANGPECRQ
jgi:AraC-like DNA-binding protein